MEQLNSNIERVIEAETTIEVLNVGAFYALVKAYKYVVVSGKSVKEKINVPFTFDLYNKDNEKISSGTISPGEKATFKVPTYKMIINNTYDYEVHIVFSFGSGTVDQLKTDLELTTEDITALTEYDKLDYEQLVTIKEETTSTVEELEKINALITTATATDKAPKLLQKIPIFISLDVNSPSSIFSVFDLAVLYPDGKNRHHNITHIDFSFDYSQNHASNASLYVTNTFNPAMSFGKYDKLKTMAPESITNWNSRKWTDRADNHLPTRSKSLILNNGVVDDDGHFRVELNEPYGFGELVIDNFILKTDIVHKENFYAPSRKTEIRTYTDPQLGQPAGINGKWLAGTFNFQQYNKCTVQKPTRTVDSNMIVIDVCVYGYLIPD